MSLTLLCCGGGGGTSGDNLDNVDNVADDGLEDIGDTLSDVFPGTIQFTSEFDSYDVNFQIGEAVVVLDSASVGNIFQVENMMQFEYPADSLAEADGTN